VLCAGFALLLAEDESTSAVNGALVGVLLSQSASPSVVLSALLLIDINLGFLTKRNLLLYSSHLPLGVPNGLVIQSAIKQFSGAVAGKEVEDLCKGSFSHTHPLLCFIVLLYFIFTCIILYQKPKKN
jgi:hypothetical protein